MDRAFIDVKYIVNKFLDKLLYGQQFAEYRIEVAKLTAVFLRYHNRAFPEQDMTVLQKYGYAKAHKENSVKVVIDGILLELAFETPQVLMDTNPPHYELPSEHQVPFIVYQNYQNEVLRRLQEKRIACKIALGEYVYLDELLSNKETFYNSFTKEDQPYIKEVIEEAEKSVLLQK